VKKKTLKEFTDRLNKAGRISQEMNHSEAVEALNIIAQDILDGKATAYHGKVLLDIRYALMSGGERVVDQYNAEAGLVQAAASLGRKGGSVKSEAKKKSGAENMEKARAARKQVGWPKGKPRKPTK